MNKAAFETIAMLCTILHTVEKLFLWSYLYIYVNGKTIEHKSEPIRRFLFYKQWKLYKGKWCEIWLFFGHSKELAG